MTLSLKVQAIVRNKDKCLKEIVTKFKTSLVVLVPLRSLSAMKDTVNALSKENLAYHKISGRASVKIKKRTPFK